LITPPGPVAPAAEAGAPLAGGAEPQRTLDRFKEVGQASAVPTPGELELLLRGVSLRVTRPRVAVLAAVHEHPHADTDSLIGVVRRAGDEVSHQAVYDVLRALTETGLVRRIQPTGSVARYEARVGDNHHHAVCRTCGAIVDVDCAIGDAPCLTPSDGAGYQIDEAEVIWWGRCPACAAAAAPQPSADNREEERSPRA
jgi:Fur family transcriptional regulator, stress-responsive regulator